MMLGANLALLMLLGQVPAGDPAAWWSASGSPRYAEREEAAGALERSGPRGGCRAPQRRGTIATPRSGRARVRC